MPRILSSQSIASGATFEKQVPSETHQRLTITVQDKKTYATTDFPTVMTLISQLDIYVSVNLNPVIPKMSLLDLALANQDTVNCSLLSRTGDTFTCVIELADGQLDESMTIELKNGYTDTCEVTIDADSDMYGSRPLTYQYISTTGNIQHNVSFSTGFYVMANNFSRLAMTMNTPNGQYTSDRNQSSWAYTNLLKDDSFLKSVSDPLSTDIEDHFSINGTGDQTFTSGTRGYDMFTTPYILIDNTDALNYLKASVTMNNASDELVLIRKSY
jgi:hypothetical protein